MQQRNKILGIILMSAISLQAFAEEIKIAVNTDEKTAVGIGYKVDGKEFGGPGKSYVGKGPKNKKYVFGYRINSAQGKNIRCGALTLTKNSNISLVSKGKKCQIVVN